MDSVGIESNTGVQFCPWSFDRHTPPSAAPANQAPSAVVASAVTRPPTREKPAPSFDPERVGVVARLGVVRLVGELLPLPPVSGSAAACCCGAHQSLSRDRCRPARYARQSY